jgi:hypothetical protein
LVRRFGEAVVDECLHFVDARREPVTRPKLRKNGRHDRATGTQIGRHEDSDRPDETSGQLLRVLRGLPATDPADDLRALSDGSRPLIVSAFRHEQGNWRNGRLTLDTTAPKPITWREARKTAQPLPAPIDVEAVRSVTSPDSEWIKAGLFRIITVQAGGQPWRLAIPTVDVELVRAAIAHPNNTGRTRSDLSDQ